MNGVKIKVPDASFELLLEFVVALKEGHGGWMTKVVDAGKYPIFDHLRKALIVGLSEKDGLKFIENDGAKHYRISTHPDFVTYNRDNLLRHPDAPIRALAGSLPGRLSLRFP